MVAGENASNPRFGGTWGTWGYPRALGEDNRAMQVGLVGTTWTDQREARKKRHRIGFPRWLGGPDNVKSVGLAFFFFS